MELDTHAELDREWHQLREKALQLLCSGVASNRSGVSALFQILVLPAFDPPVSWEVCQERQDNVVSYSLMRGTWLRGTDEKRLDERFALLPIKRKHSPPLEPSLGIETVSLSSRWIESAVVKLQSVTLPIFINGYVIGEDGGIRAGLDGTNYEFLFSSGMVEARYHWWEDGPAAWQPLTDCVREFLNDLQSFVDISTPT